MRMPLSQEDFIGNRSENGEAQFLGVTFVDFLLAHHHDSIA
jgi:hypothetical protein